MISSPLFRRLERSLGNLIWRPELELVFSEPGISGVMGRFEDCDLLLLRSEGGRAGSAVVWPRTFGSADILLDDCARHDQCFRCEAMVYNLMMENRRNKVAVDAKEEGWYWRDSSAN